MNNIIQKEIADQAELLKKYNNHYVVQIEKVAQLIKDINASSGRVFLFGSGSSLNACYFARELFSRDNDMVLEVLPAGEAENHANDIGDEDLVIFVSQSGESRDILEAKEEIKKSRNQEIIRPSGETSPKRLENIVITNNTNSTLAKSAEVVIDIRAGEEKAVPATKTYFSTLTIFTILSEVLKDRVQIIEARSKISEEIKKIIEKPRKQEIEKLVDKKIYILGSGVAWPQAMEAELKLKEIAKADAEGYELSEFMHGPVEMLNENAVVIIFCPRICNELDNKLIKKIKNKRSKIIAISSCDCEEADELIKIENKNYFELISIVVVQKLALELAKRKGVKQNNNAEKIVK